MRRAADKSPLRRPDRTLEAFQHRCIASPSSTTKCDVQERSGTETAAGEGIRTPLKDDAYETIGDAEIRSRPNMPRRPLVTIRRPATANKGAAD